MPSQADQDIAVEASLLATGLGSAAVVDDGVAPVIDMSQGSEEEVATKPSGRGANAQETCGKYHGEISVE